MAIPCGSFYFCLLLFYFLMQFRQPTKEREKKKISLYFPFNIPKVDQGSLKLCPCKLQAIQGARVQGAAKIIGIDINEKKKTKGTAFGMTDFINPNDYNKSIFELIKELTGGLGVDYCFECTGVPPLINEALQATKMVRL